MANETINKTKRQATERKKLSDSAHFTQQLQVLTFLPEILR